MKPTFQLFLVFLCLSVAVATQAQTPITTCGTDIRSPGRYELANDLLNCQGFGVRINTDGIVILNLNSHQITGTGMDSTGIVARLIQGDTNIVAIGGPGTISGFGRGVQTFDSGMAEVVNVTCIRNVTGFEFGVGANADVSSNIASENGHGFQIDNSSSEFRGNTAERNRYEGFLITGLGNSFTENKAFDNMIYGIYCSGRQNEIASNRARGNSSNDLFEANSDCINQWMNNEFGNANKPCIH